MRQTLYYGWHQHQMGHDTSPCHLILDLHARTPSSCRLQPPPAASWGVLQAANVQDIVGNARDVDQVVHAVDSAGALIDDLDQSLDVLNQKLKHMRTDITAIEARNNSLQVRLYRCWP